MYGDVLRRFNRVLKTSSSFTYWEEVVRLASAVKRSASPLVHTSTACGSHSYGTYCSKIVVLQVSQGLPVGGLGDPGFR
jgi:hypothetical protein